MAMKNLKAGASNGNDPKKKIMFGVGAIMCIIAVSLVLDVVASYVNAPAQPEPEPVTQTVPDTPEEPEAPAEEEPEEQTDEAVYADVTFMTASGLSPLTGDQRKSLGEYVAAFLETEGVDPANATVDVQSVQSDQQGTTCELYLIGGSGLHLTCTWDLEYATWRVEGKTTQQLQEEAAQKQKEEDAAAEAERDEQQQKDAEAAAQSAAAEAAEAQRQSDQAVLDQMREQLEQLASQSQ